MSSTWVKLDSSKWRWSAGETRRETHSRSANTGASSIPPNEPEKWRQAGEKRATSWPGQCGGATVQMWVDRQDSAVLSRLHRAAVSRRQRRRSARRSRGDKTRIQMEVERSLTCSLWGYRQAAFVGIQLNLTREWVQQWCTPVFQQRDFFCALNFEIPANILRWSQQVVVGLSGLLHTNVLQAINGGPLTRGVETVSDVELGGPLMLGPQHSKRTVLPTVHYMVDRPMKIVFCVFGQEKWYLCLPMKMTCCSLA